MTSGERVVYVIAPSGTRHEIEDNPTSLIFGGSRKSFSTSDRLCVCGIILTHAWMTKPKACQPRRKRRTKKRNSLAYT